MEHLNLRQAYGEEVHLHLVKEVPLPKGRQPVEAPQGLVLLPQGPVGQPLVVEEVRGLVVVIADHLRLPGTSGGLAEVRLRLGLVPAPLRAGER